jgi:hypothetical protein
MTATRIQLKRTKGWRLPEGAIVVSRFDEWTAAFHAINDRNHRNPGAFNG